MVPVVGSLPLCGRPQPQWSPQLPALAWPNSICCRNLRSKQADDMQDLSLSLALCLSNKNKLTEMKRIAALYFYDKLLKALGKRAKCLHLPFILFLRAFTFWKSS